MVVESMNVTRLPLCVLLAFLLAFESRSAIAAEPPTTVKTPTFRADDVAFYEKSVKPILETHCFKCHGPGEKIKGDLRLSNRAAILVGGDTGPAVDLKKPSESLILQAILNKRADGGEVMPPSGKMPPEAIATLTKWVNTGLATNTADLGDTHTTEPAAPKDDGKSWWAYQPIGRHAIPTVKNAAWVKTPVDAFILAKLEAKNLQPIAPAERATLIRRAHYDLTGLPPTPEEVSAFVSDRSPEAYAKLIDKLLASPHYGEKWGRHWLDVVRYAETNGYERDGPKPNVWRYRDYVIRSFNADKPYPKFVMEQLAGDEQTEWSADAIIATGFHRLGIWDDEPADREQALYDGYDDLVTVAGQGFLGMTLNCARCHDHKKDPISQADYYKFVALFRDIRPFSDTRGVMSSSNSTDISPPEKRKLYEKEFNARAKKLESLKSEMIALENEAIRTLPAPDQRASEGADRPTIVAKLLSEKVFTQAQRKQYQDLNRERKQLEAKPLPNADMALSVNDSDATPPPVHLLARGNPYSPKEVIEPGFPSVLPGSDFKFTAAKRGQKSAGRRTKLAEFIVSPNNPIAARVWVNRVWQHHFGRGIVGSPNDFGKLGELPTHPDLLDWLARELMEPQHAPGEAWTIKRLHKMLMLSNTYQLSSTASPAQLSVDPSNQMYWRFNMRRLGAEEVRDSMLLASGQLNLQQFGPSVFPKIPKEVLAGQSVPGSGWYYDAANPTLANRRSVYVSVKRSLQVPVLIAHDQADTDSTCPVRYTTTVPTQALGMLNGEFANEQADALAARLEREFPGDLSKQIRRAIALTTQRDATEAEVKLDLDFIQRMKVEHNLSVKEALSRYTLLVLNANEFVYLD